MGMKIASYNVENLFERAAALSASADSSAAAQALIKQGQINVLPAQGDLRPS